MKLSIFLWSCLGLSGLQAQRIYIDGPKGTRQVYFLSDIRKMRFSSDEITVFRVGGGLDNFAIMDVRNMHFNQVTLSEKTTIPLLVNGTFQLFPNPVSDMLNIQLSSPPGSTGKIEIISLEGKLVHVQDLNTSATFYQIDLSKLTNGLYICRINSGSVIEARKIIKQ